MTTTSVTAQITSAATIQVQTDKARIELSYRREESISRTSLRPDKEVSELTLRVLNRIASSHLLSDEEKRALIRLTAIIDEFAGGDPKLLRDVIGIAKLMEQNNANAGRTYPRMKLEEALAIYFEEREKLRANPAVEVSVHTLFEEISVQFLGMDTATALSRDSAGSADPLPA